ncbi:MAG: AAA family ATPase [Corynebacterium sp.]|uniref:DUF4435 domain-containing protein n=1 Tax=Corynebacterium sp. TaxID=1720 RepID=UPI0026DC1689|nr:AAA family ATPase [Corynebacterium sp.]MDO4761515.1 AAA family ATPase [Corynebacterium sp.]
MYSQTTKTLDEKDNTFTITVPRHQGNKEINPLELKLKVGEAITFIGANGSGKTRLAVKIEEDFGNRAHRISAHRNLTLNEHVEIISEEQAAVKLKIGVDLLDFSDIVFRTNNRYNQKPATALVNDYDALLQTLFADQNKIAVQFYHSRFEEELNYSLVTKLDQLREIWNNLLPHLELNKDAVDKIEALPKSYDGTPYSGSEMSAGERAIFYLIGQSLMADTNSILIVDEPELHIHPSIHGRLWSEIIKARPDCALIFITHDLNFASSIQGEKYILRSYRSSQSEDVSSQSWDIEAIDTEIDLNEEILTLILGSRKPVLFTEGNKSSYDLKVYQACYPNWTVVDQGTAADVIHAVKTLKKHQSFTRITCAGIIDRDYRTDKEIDYLKKKNIFTLPVSEIENVFLMPNVWRAVAELHNFTGTLLEDNLSQLTEKICSQIDHEAKIQQFAIKYCEQRLDKELKNVIPSKTKSITELESKIESLPSILDIKKLYESRVETIKTALQNKDIVKLLEICDDKGLLDKVATLVDLNKNTFTSWLDRTIQLPQASELIAEFQKVIPQIDYLIQQDHDIQLD